MGENRIRLDMDLNLGNDIDRDNRTKGKDEDKAQTNLSVPTLVVGTVPYLALRYVV